MPNTTTMRTNIIIQFTRGSRLRGRMPADAGVSFVGVDINVLLLEGEKRRIGATT